MTPTPIHDFLVNYAASNAERCHVPGNKGFPHPFDITEIAGADDLYDPRGVILESERIAAGLFGAARTFYSCSGSTLAIFAMLFSALGSSGKRRVAAARYSHRSLTDAAVLLGFDIDWVYPREFLSCAVSPDEIDAAVTDETAAVFVNGTDYYGGMSDIEAIAGVCRRRGVPLLVDNAQGAYRVFTGRHPIRLGASMCADSAHKTLPALTGAAYLHIADDSFACRARAGLALFGTSSPSYLVLDSLDLCNAHISGEKKRAEAAFEAVARLKSRLADARFTLKGADALRVTADANARGYRGARFAFELKSRGVVCEMFDDKYVVLLFSTVTESANTDRVFAAMSDIADKGAFSRPAAAAAPLKLRAALPPREAFFSPSETVPTARAAGRVCAGILAQNPPCVPLVVPGEVVTRETVELLERHNIRETACVCPSVSFSGSAAFAPPS
ncbi:MAG: aminotransferase class V-fold PLP-dependent enzyme [Oscillospiraceae bacterium]|jgi:arginine/lysine/ornithine decarboxylase|nr:aminotransferase class V-fold PLP-dependent enzyme [Oscillospiraceae bacterium]